MRRSSLSHKHHRGRVNVFVMLLMLFVVSGHCSAAMALAPALSETSGLSLAPLGHCSAPEAGDPTSEAEDHTNADHCFDNPCFDNQCFDDQCPNTLSSLHSQSTKQSPDKPVDQLLPIALTHALPFARAGPGAGNLCVASADFSTPPLFYTLCVLRL